MTLTAHGLTHTGKVRKSNEDAFSVDEELALFIVADGMGGHNAGEVASLLAVDTLRAFLIRSTADSDCTWPFGINPKLSFNGNRMLTAMRLANRRVFKASEAREEYTGMGSTAAAVLIEGHTMTFASIGDTRVYLHRAGDLVQLTEDDTWGNRIRSMDPATLPATIREGPMDHVLTKVLGAANETDADVSDHALVSGDRILLCSDGLHNMLDVPALQSIVGRDVGVIATVEALVLAALDRGGRDNVTALLIEYTESSTV